MSNTQVAKTIAAFMNANGGTLIIGVDSKGNILGLESDFAVVRDSKKPNISDEDAFGLRCSGVMEKFLD